MNTTSYWADTAEFPKHIPLRRDLDVDVVVIGAGITGITAAYLLAKAGASVAVVERDRLAAADTGHTTAHLTYVTDVRLRELVKNFGRDHAQAVWDAGAAAMNQIHEIVQKESINCDFTWVPGYLHAPAERRDDAHEIASLKDDGNLAEEFNFDATFMEQVPFVESPGIRFANQAKFHPRRYLAGLQKAASDAGAQFFEHTEATQIEVDPPLVKANGHTIRCRQVVVATHVPLQGAKSLVGAMLFQTKLASYTSYAIGATIPRHSVPEASFWDTADPYNYLRVDRGKSHDYAILGGADHKTGQTTNSEQHYERLEKYLLKLIPDARIDHRWSGQVVETNDGLPFVGENVPHQFIATGFSGNGMTFGTLAAMMALDVFQNIKNPWSDLFDVNRKKVLGGAWDYVKENRDYPYYMLKQWLSQPESSSLKEIRRDNGKVVLLKGKKVAAFRNEQGKLSLHSAVCTHMGCIVRWNEAEKTWDCPCHGSRFSATGEVMAGPAETPLTEVEE